MLDLIILLVTGTIGVFVVGYLTPKIAIWGSLGTAMVWMMAHIIPAFEPQEVIDEIVPHIIDLFFVYPTAIRLAFDDSVAADGILGGIVVLVIAVLWLFPYLFGVFLGLITWPELIVYRLLL